MITTSTRTSSLSRLFIVALLIFLAAFSAKAQQIEIVIIGSAHGNTNPNEFYRPIIDKLKSYKPDMVFGEYLSPEDQRAAIAAGHLSSKSINKKIDFLQARDPKGADK